MGHLTFHEVLTAESRVTLAWIKHAGATIEISQPVLRELEAALRIERR
jgi:hypothetical protein